MQEGLNTSFPLAECCEVARDGHNIFPKPLGLHALAPKPVIGVGQVGRLQYVLGHIVCERAVAELHTPPNQASATTPSLVCALASLSLSFTNKQRECHPDAGLLLPQHDLHPYSNAMQQWHA